MTLDRKDLNVMICTGPLHFYSIPRDDVVSMSHDVCPSVVRENKFCSWVCRNQQADYS